MPALMDTGTETTEMTVTAPPNPSIAQKLGLLTDPITKGDGGPLGLGVLSLGGVLGIGIGLGIGYFVWGRKK